MKKNLLIISITVVLIFFAYYLTTNYRLEEQQVKQPTPALTQQGDAPSSLLDPEQAEEAYEAAIPFTLQDLASEEVPWSELEGKHLIVNFWATWCKWCKQELPDIQAIHQEYDDTAILTVNVGEDAEKVKAFMQSHDYTFNVVLDHDKAVARSYSVKSIPVTLFIHPSGHIVKRHVGFMDKAQIISGIEELHSL